MLTRGGQPAVKQKRKFRFKNKLLSLDATVIALCASLFDWAQFRRTKGAVKLHLLLDHDGHLPSFAVVTEGKQHEVRVARELHFAPGTILAVDRGYTDYQWFADLTKEGVYFAQGATARSGHLLLQAGAERWPWASDYKFHVRTDGLLSVLSRQQELTPPPATH